MHIVLISLLIIALVAGLVSVVILPTRLQRAVVLLLVGLPILLIAQSVNESGRKEVAVRNHSTNIRPTAELWSIVKRDIDSGQYEQAKAHLVQITDKWEKVGPMPYSYTARDLLREIESAHKNSEQQSAPNAR
jgi:hypothetical protein